MSIEKIENEVEQELDEMKASMGDDSSIPAPTGKATKKRKADKKSKPEMVKKVVDKMYGMSKEEIEAQFGELLALDEEEASELDTSDVAEDVNTIFDGEDLSEGFKAKAQTVFEAAVAAKSLEKFDEFINEASAEAAEERSAMKAELTEQLDSYLDYVVENWMKENELAIEKGLHAEIAESFMSGLRNLFVEHNVDVPEEKVEVVEELITKVSSLEEEVNTLTADNIELATNIKEFEKDSVIDTVSEGLTTTQSAKLKMFAEAVEYENKEQFEQKLTMVKEHYFPDAKSGSTDSVVLDEETNPFVSEEDESAGKSSDPVMSAYSAAISKSIRK